MKRIVMAACAMLAFAGISQALDLSYNIRYIDNKFQVKQTFNAGVDITGTITHVGALRVTGNMSASGESSFATGFATTSIRTPILYGNGASLSLYASAVASGAVLSPNGDLAVQNMVTSAYILNTSTWSLVGAGTVGGWLTASTGVKTPVIQCSNSGRTVYINPHNSSDVTISTWVVSSLTFAPGMQINTSNLNVTSTQTTNGASSFLGNTFWGATGVQNADGTSKVTILPGSGNILSSGTFTNDGAITSRKSSAQNDLIVETFDNGATYSVLALKKSLNDTIGTYTTTDNGNVLGQLSFMGVDSGSNSDIGAFIQAIQDGAAGSRVPTRLEHSLCSASAIVKPMIEYSTATYMTKVVTPTGDIAELTCLTGTATDAYVGDDLEVADDATVMGVVNLSSSVVMTGAGAYLGQVYAIEFYDHSISTTATTFTGGDMNKATYDQDSGGVVDDSQKLNNQSASYYLVASSGVEIERVKNSTMTAAALAWTAQINSTMTTMSLAMYATVNATMTEVNRVINATMTAANLAMYAVVNATMTEMSAAMYAVVNATQTLQDTYIATKLPASSGTVIVNSLYSVISTTSSEILRIVYATMTVSDGAKVSKTGDTMTGTLTVPNIVSSKEISGHWGIFDSTMSCTQIRASSPTYAYFAWHLNQSSITTINAGATFVVVCGTGSMVDAGWFNNANDANGNPNRITYNGNDTKTMRISVAGCLATTSANATTPWLKIRKGGADIPLAEDSPYLSTQNKNNTFAINCITVMAPTNYLELWVTTDDGDPISLDNVTMTVTPVY